MFYILIGLDYNRSMAGTYLFYDLETFGLDSKADRIAQVAWIRTDAQLNVIGDPVNILCRPTPDYLPSPASCLVTGITPQDCLKGGMNEWDFINRLNDEFSVPGTTVLGFNNLAFDDEFVRNTLYRNLMDPYEREWRDGCSRWDILNLVRAVHDFRPEGMKFLHKTEKGNTSFKLVHLTEDNGIEQEGAHDALVDVYATLNVARLVKRVQPKLFEYYERNRGKAAASRLLDTAAMRPVMYTCTSFTGPNGSTRPILPLCGEKGRSGTVICFDLTQDARQLLSEDNGGIRHTKGLTWVATNRCPYLAPLTMLTKAEGVKERLGTDLELMEENIAFIKANRQRITSLLQEAGREAKEDTSGTDPELRIYLDSFYSENDKAAMKLVNALPPEKKLRRVFHFDSDKIQKLLFRQVARNWPEALNENEKILWKNYCGLRLLQPLAGGPDYKAYMRQVEDGLESIGTSNRDRLILVALREYGLQLYNDILG